MNLNRCAEPKPVRETAAERSARRQARKLARTAAIHGRVQDVDNASNHPDLAFPKGTSSDRAKADAHRAEVRQIRKTRAKVWKRTSLCEMCGDSERETAQKHAIAEHQMHEDPSRAQTRGWPVEERFNERVCGRTCCECHRLVTANVIRPIFHDAERRWLGDYDVILVADGHILRHMRRALEDRARLVPSDPVGLTS